MMTENQIQNTGSDGHPVARLAHRLGHAVALLLACLSPSCHADRATDRNPLTPQTFDVRTFGAKGDGQADDTEAIQKALDESDRAGGGIVHLSAGTYLCKPIFLTSRTTLNLAEGATLLGSPVQEHYFRPDKPQPATSSSSFFALVNGKRIEDLAITGTGTIDGAGAAWWEAARVAKYTNPTNSGYTLPRPRLIQLEDCARVRIQGVKLVNSPSFHLVPKRCTDVEIDGLTIEAPDEAPNTDGIDPSECQRVRITGCVIDVGDDNIAIKSGNRAEGRNFATEDITVADCTFRGGHGLSIGSETGGGVRNLLVERCTFDGTENGIRIKSSRGRGGRIENLVYRDLTMTNVDPAITFTAYYPRIPVQDEALPFTPETPAYRNIRISNLTATCQKEAGIIVGLPESPVEGVVLEDINITAATGLTLRNAKAVRLDRVQVTSSSGPPFLLENAEVAGLPAVEAGR